MEKLLFHVCCAPCAIHPVTELKERFDITLLFYGPNIYPEEEYRKRLRTGLDLSQKLGINLIELDYSPAEWFSVVKGFEDEPENGKRCSICYMMRLERTAVYAIENEFKYFGTTLTVSPHKPASIINPIGEKIANKYGLVFFAEDFKKNDGFRKGCQLSKEYGLYRQNYCGCEYSMRPSS